MCGVEKCCHFLKLDSGCVVIGVFNICFNMLMLLLSILWLSLDSSDHHNLGVIPIELQAVSMDTILIIICIIAVLGLVSSVALLFGIKQNRPGYLLSYFSYGIVTTILLQLGALLFLLHGFWKTSMMLFISSCTFIYFVSVVHTTYDLMLRGKHFGFNPHTTLDTEVLVST